MFLLITLDPISLKARCRKELEAMHMEPRAVNIDLAKDCSINGFLCVLRSYASIRGWPKRVFSDKGTHLVGASNELKELIEGVG